MRMFFGFPGYSNLIKGTLVGSPSAPTEAGKKHDWTAKISSNVTKKFFITPARVTGRRSSNNPECADTMIFAIGSPHPMKLNSRSSGRANVSMLFSSAPPADQTPK
ncbi:hypothetical protein BQ8794_10478 [Mesorhizobium prunaredense]|uniref:Uncharacterized protein n=1 Tax=Mesorhizobium prunaredense TaxID=1631249 RepID=A0A1R3UZN8_9HYPH|nr:hypothetical protein BQ8794_10478 [Mesorhizobium prunaredense]